VTLVVTNSMSCTPAPTDICCHELSEWCLYREIPRDLSFFVTLIVTNSMSCTPAPTDICCHELSEWCLYREIPRDLSFLIGWISGMLYFQGKPYLSTDLTCDDLNAFGVTNSTSYLSRIERVIRDINCHDLNELHSCADRHLLSRTQ